jgi:hypothetical protein
MRTNRTSKPHHITTNPRPTEEQEQIKEQDKTNCNHE